MEFEVTQGDSGVMSDGQPIDDRGFDNPLYENIQQVCINFSPIVLYCRYSKTSLISQYHNTFFRFSVSIFQSSIFADPTEVESQIVETIDAQSLEEQTDA